MAIVVERIANVGPTFISPDDVEPEGLEPQRPRPARAGATSPTSPGVQDVKDLWHLSIFDDLGKLGDTIASYDAAAFIAIALLIFTLMLADFFDTMGTMTAIGAEAGLLDEQGVPPRAEQILVVDSIAAAAGGAMSVSSNTSYIESASGVGEGARTGLASVVTGALFLLATVFTPLVSIIPNEAATPALVLVGFLMMTQVKNIDWDDVEIALPAFLTIVLMPFTYNITVGIGAGLHHLRADQAGARQGPRDPRPHVGGRGAVRRLLRDRPDPAAVRRQLTSSSAGDQPGAANAGSGRGSWAAAGPAGAVSGAAGRVTVKQAPPRLR